jgi:hypothetical protein
MRLKIIYKPISFALLYFYMIKRWFFILSIRNSPTTTGTPLSVFISALLTMLSSIGKLFFWDDIGCNSMEVAFIVTFQ